MSKNFFIVLIHLYSSIHLCASSHSRPATATSTPSTMPLIFTTVQKSHNLGETAAVRSKAQYHQTTSSPHSAQRIVGTAGLQAMAQARQLEEARNNFQRLRAEHSGVRFLPAQSYANPLFGQSVQTIGHLPITTQLDLAKAAGLRQRIQTLPNNHIELEISKLNTELTNLNRFISNYWVTIKRIDDKYQISQILNSTLQSWNTKNPLPLLDSLPSNVQLEFYNAANQIMEMEDRRRRIPCEISIAQAIITQRQEQFSQLQSASKNLTEFAKTQSLIFRDQGLVQAINQTIKENGALHPLQLQATPEVRAALASIGITENMRCTTFQKYLIEHGSKVLTEQQALLKAYAQNSRVNEYIQTTIKFNAAALQMTHAGSVQDAITATKIAAALRDATIGFLKGLDNLAATATMTGVAVSLVPELGGALLATLGYDAASFAYDCIATSGDNIQVAIETFNNLPLEQQAEQIGFYGPMLFSPFIGELAHNAHYKEGLASLSKIAKTEYAALRSYVTLDKAYVVQHKGFSFPQQYQKVITRLIDEGKIKKQTQVQKHITSLTGPVTHFMREVTHKYVRHFKSLEESATILKATSLELLQTLRAKKTLESGFLKHLDPTVGNITRLEEAINLFKNVPGTLTTDGPITKLLECGIHNSNSGKLATARGAAFELEAAFDLAKSGETIVAFGNKAKLLAKDGKTVIQTLDIDIETTTKIFESKNWDWSRLTEGQVTNYIQRIKEKAPLLRNLAMQQGKEYILFSKYPMPSILKSWMTEKGIKVIEGKL